LKLSTRGFPKHLLQQFRGRLAHADALPQLAIMAVICGVVTGFIVIAFRLTIEWPLSQLLPGQGSEDFESLAWQWRLALPLLGALGLCLTYAAAGDRLRLGVSQVIERYQLHQGKFPASDIALQFVAGVAALITGHSGGREGPAVHLGAASSSVIGQWLKLPNNSLRVLVGCGIAAAIAASFNTPLAGVIFAMEVVMLEYTVIGFIPIIISAVIGSLLCRPFFGTEPAFFIPDTNHLPLWELPWLILCGFVIGLVSTIMLTSHKWLLRFRHRSHWLRFMAAGIATSVIGLAVPETLGMGYDTVQEALSGSIGLQWLLAIIAGKLVLFTFTFAMGVPVGGIGPMFFLGSCIGAVWGATAQLVAPDQAANAAIYSILGMGAMMAAALNAPLAALVAILELTNSPTILLPSMMVIVCASLTTRLTSKLPGLFLIGNDPKRFTSPVMQTLNRTGVTSIMQTDFIEHSRNLPWHKIETILTSKPRWLVIADIGEPRYLLPPADLSRFIATQDTLEWPPEHTVDLMAIPADRRQMEALHAGATLQEALILMKKNQVNAVYIHQMAAPLMSDIAGIISREDIEAFYQV
jgi:chloride channel protein, CIC family